MLYRVVKYEASKTERCFEPTKSTVVGNLKVARLQAKAWLPEQAETTHSARYARHPWVDIAPCVRFAKRSGGRQYRETRHTLECVETPIMYVPSVGDMGWTP